MEDSGGIEPLTATSRYACFRGRLDHLITHYPTYKIGRGSRIRTRDIRFWRPTLYQLSYTPTHKYLSQGDIL